MSAIVVTGTVKLLLLFLFRSCRRLENTKTVSLFFCSSHYTCSLCCTPVPVFGGIHSVRACTAHPWLRSIVFSFCRILFSLYLACHCALCVFNALGLKHTLKHRRNQFLPDDNVVEVGSQQNNRRILSTDSLILCGTGDHHIYF